MLHGIGVDIVEIARIERAVERHGARFVERVFTRREQDYCARMARPGPHFAVRWAAKEAFYKALPGSLQKLSSWQSVEIAAEDERRPLIRVLAEPLREAMATADLGNVHVSLSHEQHYCVAFVVLA